MKVQIGNLQCYNQLDSWAATSLEPQDTGLHDHIWIYVDHVEGDRSNHGPMVKVHKNQSVIIYIRQIDGEITEVSGVSQQEIDQIENIQLIQTFIKLNLQVLLCYWDMKCSTSEIINALKKL